VQCDAEIFHKKARGNIMQIVLVSRTGAVLDAYRQFFGAQSIDLIHLNSISELFQKFPETVFSGFVVDIQSALKATEPEKEWLRIIESTFPNVRTNWNPERGFRALYNDSSKTETDNLSIFLEDCRKFRPRALRKHERKEIHFPVLFWPIEEPEEKAERAYTLNISYGGLFVCTCYAPLVDSLVWVRLREMSVQPTKVLVRLRRVWGNGLHIPGFGGSYVDLNSDLAEKLKAVLQE
jgi:hypothetical protein